MSSTTPTAAATTDDNNDRMDDYEEEEEEEEEEVSSGGWRSAAWGEHDQQHHHHHQMDVDHVVGNNGGSGGDAGEEVEDISECLSKFSSPDYIMEPGIFNQLKRYFQSGGSPEQVIELLSSNYNAFAQMANLMAEWIISAGASINEVRTMVEASLTDMIVKTFDPKKADTIFTEEGETPSWLTEMIEHPTWRSLVYKLAEEYPDCLMLNFTIKLISDAGFQGEITSISTASQQIEVFSRMVKTSILKILASNEDTVLRNMQDTAEMICHSEHTFVYSQVLLNVLLNDGGNSGGSETVEVDEEGGGSIITVAGMGQVRNGHLIKRLCQEIVKQAHHKGHDVTAVVMSLNGSTQYPRACQALSAMLSRNALNPADITVLFKMYSQPDPPPVELIRAPQFLDLLIEALFRPGSRLNPEHKGKYIYLLAYAASVVDVFRRAVRQTLRQDELKPTMAAVDKVHSICYAAKNHNEIITELQSIYTAIKYPVVSIGVLRWIEFTVTEPSYFKLQTEHTPIHIALLDEIASCHNLLHSKVFDLVVHVLKSSLLDDLDVLVQLEMRKMLLDRLVNLLTRGHVVPVLKYVKQCWTTAETDVSLIRYFVNEVLEVVGPPYSPEFVSLFLPMVESDEVTGSHDPNAEHDPVAEFVVHCKASTLMLSSSSGSGGGGGGGGGE